MRRPTRGRTGDPGPCPGGLRANDASRSAALRGERGEWTAAELAVEGVTLQFGGITALDDVRFAVAPGSVHALIGPNGAGKSSCFNVISGLYRPTMGAVRLGERLLTSMAAHQLAGLGIGRSFQNIALSPGSTVLDNVLLGRHALTSGGFLSGGLRLERPRGAPARGPGGRDLRLPGHRRPAGRSGRRAALRGGQAGRHRPCAGRRTDPAAAGRAGGRAERRRRPRRWR